MENKKSKVTEEIDLLHHDYDDDGGGRDNIYKRKDHQGETLLCYRIDHKEHAIAWIQTHLPSSICRSSSGLDWVYVCRPSTPERNPDIDVDGLLQAWERVLKTGKPITFQMIQTMAKNHHVTAGKWIFFAESGAKINLLWEKIATSIVDLSAPFSSAKVSTASPEDRHVTSIFDYDFTNKDELLKLEDAIRNVGIKCTLKYKPDIYTYIGVFRKNPWGLRPAILESQFDIATGRSVITSDVMEL